MKNAEKRLKECSTVFHSLWRSETISLLDSPSVLRSRCLAGRSPNGSSNPWEGQKSDLVSPQSTTPSCYMLEPPVPIITESESNQRNSCLGTIVTSRLEYPQVALSLVVVVVAPQTQKGSESETKGILAQNSPLGVIMLASFVFYSKEKKKKKFWIEIKKNMLYNSTLKQLSLKKKSVSMVKRGLI